MQEEEQVNLNWELSRMEFLARLLGSRWRIPRMGQKNGELGGYCKGTSLEECRRVFGEKLPEICATCPE